MAGKRVTLEREYDQLDRAELRGIELAEREKAGDMRDTVDECGIQMRRLRRSVSERADSEIDRAKAYKAFSALACAAAKGMAQLQPGTLPAVKKAS